MTKINHWLYGEDKRKFQIDKETDCSKCIHQVVCNRLFHASGMEVICQNYLFGTSAHGGCGGCQHRFTRWDKEQIPCFICGFFEEKQ